MAIEPRNVHVRSAEALTIGRRKHRPLAKQERLGLRGVEDPMHARKHLTRKPGDPVLDLGQALRSAP